MSFSKSLFHVGGKVEPLVVPVENNVKQCHCKTKGEWQRFVHIIDREGLAAKLFSIHFKCNKILENKSVGLLLSFLAH